MPIKDQAYIKELEQRITQLEDTVQQATRIRQQWHDAVIQLRQTQAKQKSSETMYRIMHGNAFDAILLADDAGMIVDANPAASKMFGWSFETLVGMKVEQLIPESLKSAHHTGFERYQKTGKAHIMGQVVELDAQRENGDIFPIELVLAPLQVEHATLFSATIRDISKRKQAEFTLKSLNLDLEEKVRQRTQELEVAGSRLRAKQQRLQAIIDNSTISIGAVDTLGHYTLVNRAFEVLLGYSNEGMLQMGPVDITHPDDREDTQQRLKQLMHGEINHFRNEKRLICKDGQVVWCDVSVAGIYDEHGRLTEVIGMMVDITTRKAEEAELRKLSKAMSQAGESIMITDKEGMIEYVNAGFTRIMGYSADEAIGNTPRLLKSGKQDHVFYERMWHTISHGEIWTGRVVDQRKNGDLFPAHLTIAPIMNDHQEVTHYVGIARDLTAQEELEQQIRESRKMESLGVLAGGIAHEFNNMLAGMTGNLYLALQQTQSLPKVTEHLKRVQKISFRAADMIRQLLTFAHKDMVQMKPIDFAAFIQDTLKLYRVSVPENVHLNISICSTPLMVDGDVTQLQQIVLNLLGNACDAVADTQAPSITVTLAAYKPTAQTKKVHSEITATSFAHFSISDNGYGISQKNQQGIFEPFMTTKAPGEGTGLGLSMVLGAVQMHHGFIDVDSEEGTGTYMHVFLPLLDNAEAAQEEVFSDHANISHGQSACILFADDEEIVLETGAMVLEGLGYTVLQAHNGREAVDIFQAQQQNITLVLLDVIMPEMGGVEAARNIRASNPDIPIVFSTGYDKQEVTNQAKGLQHIEIITKPWRIDCLHQCIQEMIGGK